MNLLQKNLAGMSCGTNLTNPAYLRRQTSREQVRENEVRGKMNGGGNLMTIRTADRSIHLRKR
jgi:hypothetical protein